jgi:uncharacterized protein (TIRG00374 family)
VIISIVLLYLAFRGVNFKTLLLIARTAQFQFIVAAFLVSLTSFTLRAIRWRVLLSAEKPVSLADSFWANAAGYLGNSLLPARAGEWVRSYLVGKKTGLGASYVLATAFAERVLDAIFLVVVSVIAISRLQNLPDWLTRASSLMGIAAVVCLAGLFLLAQAEAWVMSRARLLPQKTPFREQFVSILQRFLLGVKALKSVRRMTFFLLYSLALWACDVLGTILMARAFGMLMSFSTALVLLAGLGLSSAIPSTPGYVGVYQFVAVSILPLFGFSKDQALVMILASQAFNYLMVFILGGIGVARFGGWDNLRKIAAHKEA